MIDCYYSGDCAGCSFDGKCLIQNELVENEKSLKAMVGLLVAIPIGCEVIEKLEVKG